MKKLKLKLEISRLHYDNLREFMRVYESCEAEIVRLLDAERHLEGSYIQQLLQRRRIRNALKDLRIAQEAIKAVWWIDSTVMFKALKEQDKDEAE